MVVSVSHVPPAWVAGRFGLDPRETGEHMSSADNESASTSVNATELQKPGQWPWIVWALAAVVAILVIALVIVLVNCAGSRDSGNPAKPVARVASAESGTADSDTSTAHASPKDYGSFAVLELTGSGDDVLKIPKGARAAIVKATHKGTRYFVVETLNRKNLVTGRLVSTVGKYKGTTMYVQPQAPAKLKITADGAWTIRISPVSSAKRAKTSNKGTGDAVLFYDGAPAEWRFKHKGSSGFAVRYINPSGTDLLIDTSGKYSGVVPTTAGPGYFAITAGGKWTMKAR